MRRMQIPVGEIKSLEYGERYQVRGFRWKNKIKKKIGEKTDNCMEIEMINNSIFMNTDNSPQKTNQSFPN